MQSLCHIYFSIYFFNLLATLFNFAFRQKLTIRSVKRKRDNFPRLIVKVWEGYSPETLTQHEGQFPDPEITTTINNFTFLLFQIQYIPPT